MQYRDIHIPEADPADLAATFQASDPVAEAEARLAEIEDVERALATEKAKWERALLTAELFSARKPNGAGAADAADQREQAPPASQKPRTRREAVVRLFDEEASRVWRTRELVYELFHRDWNTAASKDSEANSVSRILSELEADGFLMRIRKGNYKRNVTSPRVKPEMFGEQPIDPFRLDPEGRTAPDGERTGAASPGGST
jgi:hypothetical protein